MPYRRVLVCARGEMARPSADSFDGNIIERRSTLGKNARHWVAVGQGTPSPGVTSRHPVMGSDGHGVSRFARGQGARHDVAGSRWQGARPGIARGGGGAGFTSA